MRELDSFVPLLLTLLEQTTLPIMKQAKINNQLIKNKITAAGKQQAYILYWQGLCLRPGSHLRRMSDLEGRGSAGTCDTYWSNYLRNSGRAPCHQILPHHLSEDLPNTSWQCWAVLRRAVLGVSERHRILLICDQHLKDQ